MTTYRAMTVTGQRHFELRDREPADPPHDHVRLRVEACGICHTDLLAVDGIRRYPSVPLVPGHEIVGVIDEVGLGVPSHWRPGDRVGVGFLGGQDNTCQHCGRGDFVHCSDQPLTGTNVDGGYAEFTYARASSLVRIPKELTSLGAAPLLCAGLTVYKALISTQVPSGSLVGIQGLGGLGHLGVQYAKAMGYEVVAIARGAEKSGSAKELGAHDYVDSTTTDPAKALQRRGGAAAIVATAASGTSMSPLVRALRPSGQLVVVGNGLDPIQVHTDDLVLGERTLRGSLTGTPIENEDNLRFAVRHGIHSWNEVLPLERAPEGYRRMLGGAARFRVVLDMQR